MEVTLLPAYELANELEPLYEEYGAMLVAGDPVFAASLAQQHFDEELDHLHDKYDPPQGRLYLLKVDGKAAGCIGLRRIDDTYCEMKRMFLRPEYRGLGYGNMMARQLLADAKSAGYRYMRLDTLPFLESAQALYRKLGFYEIPSYYDCVVPGTIFMEKLL